MTTLRRRVMLWSVVLAIVVLAGFGAIVTKNHFFDTAALAIKEGRYESALGRLKLIAALGDSDAQYLLGEMFAFGWGVPKDDVTAIEWFRRAEKSSETLQDAAAPAMYYIGERYLEGLGVPRSEQEARKWFQRSAEGGYSKAKDQLEKMAMSSSR